MSPPLEQTDPLARGSGDTQIIAAAPVKLVNVTQKASMAAIQGWRPKAMRSSTAIRTQPIRDNQQE